VIAVLGLAASLIAAASGPLESPLPTSENAARERLKTLGFTDVRSLKRNGDWWQATVLVNGRPELVRINVVTGAWIENGRRRPQPIEIRRPAS
jgi:hypothetical protein